MPLGPKEEAGSTYIPSVAVDMDGTLNYYDTWEGIENFGKLFKGAKEFLERLQKKFRVIIHTCRCNEELNKRPAEELREIIQQFMESNSLPYDEIWVGKGKPIAEFYLDDRGVNCSPGVDPDVYDKICTALGI